MMEPSDDRRFAEVRDRFQAWREARRVELGRERSRAMWDLLRDYRAGLVSDDEAHERMHVALLAEYGQGILLGIEIGTGGREAPTP